MSNPHRPMISPGGLIEDFLAAVEGESLAGVKETIKAEKRAAEAIAKGAAKAGDRAVADPMFDYVQSLRCLMYWLTRGARPRNCGCFAMFRGITEAMVERGEMGAEVMGEFGESLGRD